MRTVSSLLLVAMCSLLLVACGGDDDTSTTSSTTTSSEAAPTATAVATGTGPVPGPAQIKLANAACKKTTLKLNALPPLPTLNPPNTPENPGDQVREYSTFLNTTDPNDQIERELLAELTTIAPDGGGAYAELVAALGSIIEHETARNSKGEAGDLPGYQEEYKAADEAYADLRAAARKLRAPDCTLGS